MPDPTLVVPVGILVLLGHPRKKKTNAGAQKRLSLGIFLGVFRIFQTFHSFI